MGGAPSELPRGPRRRRGQGRGAVARQLDAIISERDRLQRLLTAAERRFEKAQAALDRERGRVDAARDAAAKAREHEAEVERDAAAQVAAAQLSATAAIEAEVSARASRSAA